MLANILFKGPAFCEALVPRESPHALLYGAMICGTDVPEGLAKSLFIDCGLIHILVVSGAHLVFLEQLIRHLPTAPKYFVLTAYCWLTGWGAPVVRALVARAVRPFAVERAWTALQAEAVTTVVTLLCHPPWLASRSFLMSWLCVVALRAPGRSRRFQSLLEGLKVYVLLYPFSLAAPLTIAWNCLLAPIIGRVMFPAALLGLIWPRAHLATDVLWDGLLWLLGQGPHLARGPLFLELGWIWWVPWVAHGVLIGGEWLWRRAWAYS